MKGTIVCCLRDLIIEKFGKDKWEKSLVEAGLRRNQLFVAPQDIPDATVMKTIQSVCKVLNISLAQAADAFGDYWVNVYAKKVYSIFFSSHKDARSFLLSLDKIHVTVTKSMPNAMPPRFEYEWKDEKTLIMNYKSHRTMIDFLPGLIKGVGNYYHENLRVSKLSPTKIQVVFS